MPPRALVVVQLFVLDRAVEELYSSRRSQVVGARGLSALHLMATHALAGVPSWDSALDVVRQKAEHPDQLPDFPLTNWARGGPGSDMATLPILQVRQGYLELIPNTIFVTLSPKVSNTTLDPYNGQLATKLCTSASAQ
ncbi:hypothetical protein MTO96_018132 [Rhipicephalus appendiculatus]